MDDFKRKVVKVVKTDEERSSSRGRSFSWSMIEVRVVTAECGHTRTLRGFTSKPPKYFNPCKDCMAGKPVVPVEGPLGFIDNSSTGIKNPVARALINNAGASK